MAGEEQGPEDGAEERTGVVIEKEKDIRDLAETSEPQAALEPTPQSDLERFNALEDIANRIEAAGENLKKIRAVCMKMAFPGDWVQFGTDEEGKLELDGPGADRIRPLLGISLRNWNAWRESWTDSNGKAYTWYYEADVYHQGRLIAEKVLGRASSRNKFFGYANGAWKDLADVPEHDIRIAANRSVNKEAVKAALGIRAIPRAYAIEILGLDPKKIKKVKFDNAKTSGDKGGDAGKKVEVVAKVVKIGQKKAGKNKDKTVYVIGIDSKDYPSVETFSETDAKSAKSLIDKPAKMMLQLNGRWAPKLLSIEVEVEFGGSK